MKQINSALVNCGAVAAGVVDICRLYAHMTPAQIERATHEMPAARSVICALFPYFAGFQPGNIALYARGKDYHLALNERLGFAARGLKELFPTHEFRPYVDSSPYPEVYAAIISGLGMKGANGLVIRPPHGSFLFIGLLATTLALDAPWTAAPCKMCGKCVEMCPTGALTECGTDASKCLSSITQRRGALSDYEREAVKRVGMAWGCDVCQKVCPLNRDLKVTALPEFASGLIFSFPPEDITLSKREFAAKYGLRAFAWRGPGPLKRNIEILKG